MIKNIIFDFGNVIGKFDRNYILKNFVEADDIDLFEKVVFENWNLIDDGAIEYDNYINEKLAILPERLKQNALNFFADWYKFIPYTDGITELIYSLKNQGFGIYLLSNAPTYFSLKNSFFKVLEVFDGKVFSADEKLSKPDARIYELLLSRYKLNAGECLFIDDVAENIKAADVLGINTYHFKNDATKLKAFIEVL